MAAFGKNVIGGLIFASFTALVGCTEVPVKEVKECSKITAIEARQSMFLGLIPEDNIVFYYGILDNGKEILLNPSGGTAFEVNSNLGKTFCKTHWKPIKK